MHAPAIKWPAQAAAALALALLAADAAGANACSKPIEVSSGDWAPYNYFDAQGKYKGIDVDMSRAIVKEAGCTLVEKDPMPAARNTTLFAQGKIDMMMGASRTPDREVLAFFSLPYRDETVQMFALADKFAPLESILSFSDFMKQPLVLLAPRIGWYGGDYAKAMPALKSSKRLWQFTNFGHGMHMLAAGRGTFILGDVASVEYAAAKRGVSVRALPFQLTNEPVHIMLSRKTMTATDLRLIDGAIDRLRKRGVLERIARGEDIQ